VRFPWAARWTVSSLSSPEPSAPPSTAADLVNQASTALSLWLITNPAASRLSASSPPKWLVISQSDSAATDVAPIAASRSGARASAICQRVSWV
jgi:hypothetical protein